MRKRRPRPRSGALRAAAWTVVAAGIAAPVVRRRVRLPAAAVLGTAAAAPVAACVALRRTVARDVLVCCLQMWAYVAAYEMPHDDPERLMARVRIDYPLRIDRALGLGTPPNLILQRRLARPRQIGRLDRVLTWTHWLWFFTPHAALVYVLARKREQFPRAAVMTYATFDIGVTFYWFLPTAPPWYAAQQGRMESHLPLELRRMMVEYGEQFWKDRWVGLYDLLGGNPLAAMPSLHFATSVMSARNLAEVDRVAGAVGWAYALTLGFALVHLGEHYVADLLAGAALTETIRRAGPRASPLLRGFSRAIQRLEARAHA